MCEQKITVPYDYVCALCGDTFTELTDFFGRSVCPECEEKFVVLPVSWENDDK